MASRVEVLKFLASAFNMVKNGDIKSLEDLFSFARQQFGQVDAKLSKQIKDTFDKGKVAAVTEKRTKDISMGDPTGEKREGLTSLLKDLDKNLKDLKDLDKQQTNLNEELMDAMMGFKKAEGSKDTAKPFKTPGMTFKKQNPGYRLPGGSMYAEGNLRTAIRQFLKTELDAGKLKLSEEDAFRVKEYSSMSADDPIDVFRRYYGEDALEAADAMASKLEKGTSFKNYEEIFRSNMPELKIKAQGAGSYDQSIIDAERVLQEAKDQEDYAKTLDEFDVTDRKKNAEGGIMSTRAKFKSGKIKLLLFLKDRGMNFTTEVRRALNNIFESGDKKLDADMVVDDMFENLGIDKDAVDQKDVLKVYDEAYDLLGVPPGSRGGPDDIAAPFSSEKVDLPEGVKSEDTILPTDDLVSSQLKLRSLAEEIQPGLFENLNDTQINIINKFGGRIDSDLLKNIVLDPDPNNQAAAVAALDQAQVLLSKGMSMNEVMSILQSTPRTKQAEGGLAGILKL
jgi:hypothetical protein